jgi:glyoxylase-like metal-dependent hydrolase (beta-lactamase superfamily II)
MKVEKNGSSVVRLDDGIFLIPGPKKGGCNIFVLAGTRRTALIDTGMPKDHGALCSGLSEIGLSLDGIDMVILTHEHIDHVGNLPNLPGRTVVAAHARAANKLQLDDEFSKMSGAFGGQAVSIHVDLHLEDGSLIDLGGIRLRTIYTPGHSSGAICLYEPERGAMFTSDTIFAGGILGGIFASGNISDYISSLRRLREFKVVSMYPGHGRMSSNPGQDLERAIEGASLLLNDTRNLFESINAKGAFDHLMRATADYSRRAAERREHARVASDLEALAHLEDASHPVGVSNISRAGARLDRELSIAAGETVRLTLDCIGDLECEVIAHIDGHTRLKFMKSSPDLAQMELWLSARRNDEKPAS